MTEAETVQADKGGSAEYPGIVIRINLQFGSVIIYVYFIPLLAYWIQLRPKRKVSKILRFARRGENYEFPEENDRRESHESPDDDLVDDAGES